MVKSEYEKQLQEIEKQNGYALSKISHEIRNPVTLINSFLQLIESQHPEVYEFKYWSQVMENMDFLKSLLAELSDYNNSKILHIVETNPYRMLQSLIDSVAPTLKLSRVDIRLIKETAIPTLLIDVTKVREAILNLIRNAQEAMPDGGEIKISICSDGDTVSILVHDNGPGIPIKYIDTLFEPFVTHKKDGTGLGLAIAKNVMESHHGTISVSSPEGEGTTFTLIFPV